MAARGDPKVILIHGNGGSTAGDIWLPWLERECEALGLPVVNQTFPDNVKARALFWLPFLEDLGADEHTILIGHSSGALAAMRFAETYRLLGSILRRVSYRYGGQRGSGAAATAPVAVEPDPREPGLIAISSPRTIRTFHRSAFRGENSAAAISSSTLRPFH